MARQSRHSCLTSSKACEPDQTRRADATRAECKVSRRSGPMNRARSGRRRGHGRLLFAQSSIDQYATLPTSWSASARPQVGDRRQDGVLVAAGHPPVTGVNLNGRGSRGPASGGSDAAPPSVLPNAGHAAGLPADRVKKCHTVETDYGRHLRETAKKPQVSGDQHVTSRE
jgi:hypothetical protein